VLQLVLTSLPADRAPELLEAAGVAPAAAAAGAAAGGADAGGARLRHSGSLVVQQPQAGRRMVQVRRWVQPREQGEPAPDAAGPA
jgi:hypothetical protein